MCVILVNKKIKIALLKKKKKKEAEAEDEASGEEAREACFFFIIIPLSGSANSPDKKKGNKGKEEYSRKPLKSIQVQPRYLRRK